MSDTTYTTGDIAKIIGVNFRTVIRWIQRGELKGYKLPGRGDHRVTQDDLLEFMQEHDIPVPVALKKEKRILVVDDDPAMAAAIERVLKRDKWQVEVAHNGFDAGLKLLSFDPMIMTLDLSMPKLDGMEVIRSVRQSKETHQPKILVISGLDVLKLQQAVEQGADAYLEKPFDNQALLNCIHGLVT